MIKYDVFFGNDNKKVHYHKIWAIEEGKSLG